MSTASATDIVKYLGSMSSMLSKGDRTASGETDDKTPEELPQKEGMAALSTDGRAIANAVFTSVHAKMPAELLAKGLNRMEGSYYRGRQSLGARADEAASERLLGQPQDFQKRLLEKAAKVTPEQLREVARKYLLVDKMYEVTLLP